MEDKEFEMRQKVCEEVTAKICEIVEQGIGEHNVEYLGDLVDIHKDLNEEEYHERKLDSMRYSNYGNDMNYGRGRRRRSNGQYMESERYNERGRGGRGNYGHKYIDEMDETYGMYHEDKNRYGSDEATMRSLEEMLKSVEKFMKHLESEAGSEEEIDMIKETAERIAR